MNEKKIIINKNKMNDLELFHPKKAELIVTAEKYKDLVIDWINDKEWYKLVYEGVQVLSKMRIWIKKTCKDYTDQFEKKKKEAWSMRDELLEITEQVEKDLKEKRKAIDNEKAELKLEKEREKAERLNERMQKLSSISINMSILEIEKLSDWEFEAKFNILKKDFEEKEEKRREEAEEIKRQKQEIQEAQEEIKRQKQEIEDEKNKIIQDEKDRKSKIELKAKEEADRIQKERDDIQAEKDKIENDKLIKIREEEMKIKLEAEAEEKRLADIQRKKEEAEIEKKRVEKKRKYKNFIDENKGKYDREQRDLDNRKVILWKKIWEFNY